MPLRRWPTSSGSAAAWLRRALLGLAALLYGLHFLHLAADFPAGTHWNDWSRFTDEGWYSDAAVRHFVLGHWYLPGDFNPAVAMPVWPLLLTPVFAVTGVSIVAARALMVALFGLGLVGVCRLLDRSGRKAGAHPGFAGPLAVFLLSASPFVYAFVREAVLEPLLTALAVWALVAAMHLQPIHRRAPLTAWGPAVALGLLLPAMVLTKPTAVALLPAVAWMVWARAGYRGRALVQAAWLPACLAGALWAAYLLLWVRPRYLEDYRYLFSANDYTSIQADPLWQVLYGTVADGVWMGAVLCVVFLLVLGWIATLRPELFRRPLVPALLVWIAGYLSFLAYHNNLQSRYYLLLAVPVTMVVALALEAFLSGAPGSGRRVGSGARRHLRLRTDSRLRAAGVAACVLAIAVPDLVQQWWFQRHPAYTYRDAARQIAATVRADRAHSPWVLSVSGSDLGLMTGLPSINTEFSTLDLDQLVARYRPGWYVTWNQVDDEDLQGIAPLYRLRPVAAYPAMDDPDRNVLLLYRLEPRH